MKDSNFGSKLDESTKETSWQNKNMQNEKSTNQRNQWYSNK